MPKIIVHGIPLFFEENWNEKEQEEFIEKFSRGLDALEKIIGKVSAPPNHIDAWRIIKSEDTTKANAITDTNKHQLEISPNCPWFSFVHELYHLAHGDSDFRIDIFEEGIAIASSVLVCRILGEKTSFEFENFEFNDKKLNIISNDPIIPLDQFIYFLPMRYNILGKFWIEQERKNKGLLGHMTQINCNFKEMKPPDRILKLFDLLNKFSANVANELINLWGIKIQNIYSKNFPQNNNFMLFFDNINKILHLLSWGKKQKSIETNNWKGIGIIEIGVPRSVTLFFSKIEAGGLVNQPTIKINSSGHAAFHIANVPNLLGESPRGYLVKAMDGEKILDELVIKL